MIALVALFPILVASVTAFTPVRTIRRTSICQKYTFEQYSTFTTDGERNNSTNALQQFFQGWFNIFTPVKSKDTAIVTNLSGYKGSYTSELKGKKGTSYWKNQDIVEDFVSKYLGANVQDKSKTKKLLGRLSKLDDKEELLDTLDEYLIVLKESRDDPFTASEIFIADTLIEMAKPMPTKMDQTKIVKSPMKLPKPMRISKLMKILKSNPNYFK